MYLSCPGRERETLAPDPAGELDPGSAAAVLLIEDLWAAPLAGALDRSGGVLLEGARIPKDLIVAEITELAAAS
jgi:hypothetical protein